MSDEEIIRALIGFVDGDWVNYVAVSTRDPNAWKAVRENELAYREGYEPYTVTQPRYNFVIREIEANPSK